MNKDEKSDQSEKEITNKDQLVEAKEQDSLIEESEVEERKEGIEPKKPESKEEGEEGEEGDAEGKKE